ncbi:type I-E CRISPR-associated protein Cas6/Cse3/CasE [Lentilactobacillus raoultii]|uniref:Type I-E CRISPR-associated protein Cas6/Cse3/CasE n=1 Tax=Lentilactobacillus raoultii TaxID=1987503 RepID=A0ABW3PF15_9LACO|nr:type I-E CRISPR-associated protein Cas6/Cse3/CasE [Lentilactobacillus raoultii]
MYLSRVEIDIKNRQKIKDLTHLGAFHNWVEKSFPKEIAAGKRSRHLWRIDNLAGKKYLLVLSQTQPDLLQLSTYGVPGTAQVKSYDQFLDQLHEGQTLQFRLTANPSYSVIKPGERQGRIYPHVTVAQQRKWLASRAENLGFHFIGQDKADFSSKVPDHFAFDVMSRDWPILYRKGGHRIKLSRVTFEGLLQVADLERFKETLIHGIGREKAFGMGLMTVIPKE